jgi:hypothetical protein
MLFRNGCQLLWTHLTGCGGFAAEAQVVSNGCLDRAAAQGAGGVPEQPAVDARQVERVAAHRQAPRALAGLELLRRKKDRQERLRS